MKDLYSFARSQEEHSQLYESFAEAYHRVYDRLGIGAITYRTAADGGYFTDKFSDEFQTLSDIGEDTIYVDVEKKLAINDEILSDENLKKLGLSRDRLVEKRSVEVGNIFPLESKYTDALDVYYTDESGNKQSIIMGCYGIGISRVMGVLAEHFSDENGLIWSDTVAPFRVHLVQIGDVSSDAQKLYDELQSRGIDVLWDDRDERAGAKFADADLIGIPHRVVVSEKHIANQRYEYKKRTQKEPEILTEAELFAKL